MPNVRNKLLLVSFIIALFIRIPILWTNPSNYPSLYSIFFEIRFLIIETMFLYLILCLSFILSLGKASLFKFFLYFQTFFYIFVNYFTIKYSLELNFAFLNNVLISYTEAPNFISFGDVAIILIYYLPLGFFIHKISFLNVNILSMFVNFFTYAIIFAGIIFVLNLELMIRRNDFRYELHLKNNLYANPLSIYRAIFYLIKNQNSEYEDITKIYQFKTTKKLPSNLRVVFILDESLAANKFGISNPKINTTPLLSKRKDLINYKKIKACGTHTIVSVPCIFSPLGQGNEANFGKYNSLSAVFASLGFDTYWFSNHTGGAKPFNIAQRGAQRIINKETMLTKYGKSNIFAYDKYLLKFFDEAISNKRNAKKFIVFHMRNTHAPYRHPSNFNKYPEGKNIKNNKLNRYLNSILAHDYIVNYILNKLDDKIPTVVFYTADHGESFNEYYKGRIYNAHGAGYNIAPPGQLEVPFFIWYNNAFTIFGKKYISSAKTKVKSKNISHDNLFFSILGCVGIKNNIINSNQLNICK